MVKTIAAPQPATDKGGQTRRHIFRCALELFRVQGFEATTMKQIAVKAGVAKGAAYYYFPGKEALIQAYYETIQTEQERICAEVFAEDRRRGLNHYVMVRTDRKPRAEQLADIYQRQTQLRLKVVHSGLSPRTVKKVLEALGRGELDGVICVNMMGEGFNFPAAQGCGGA